MQRRRRKWQEAYANDVITLDELRGHMEEERRREEMIRERLEPAAASEVSEWSKEELIELISQFREAWHTVEDELAKKQFVQLVFKSIVIDSPVEKAVARPGKKIPVDIKEIIWNT